MKKISHESKTNNNPFIIPVFIMNSGCPHRCIFCNQEITAGNFPQKIAKDFSTRILTRIWHGTKINQKKRNSLLRR